MKNIVENQDIKNDKPLALSYEQLKQRLDAVVAQRDALAAENCIQDCIITAVKDLVHDSEGVIGWHLNGEVASWDEVLPELSHGETPTTSAALAEVEAKAIEKFAAKFDLHIKAAGLTDEDTVTVLECKDALKHVVELREGRV